MYINFVDFSSAYCGTNQIVKGFAPWILFDYFKEKFYIHWSAGRSPRFHEVNPGRDPSTWYQSHGFENVIKI